MPWGRLKCHGENIRSMKQLASTFYSFYLIECNKWDDLFDKKERIYIPRFNFTKLNIWGFNWFQVVQQIELSHNFWITFILPAVLT